MVKGNRKLGLMPDIELSGIPKTAQVKTLIIDKICNGGFPCEHSCTVTLFDGRAKKATLDADAIASLVRDIARLRFCCDEKWGIEEHLEHFSMKDHSSYFLSSQAIESAEDIVKRMFSKEV